MDVLGKRAALSEERGLVLNINVMTADLKMTTVIATTSMIRHIASIIIIQGDFYL